MRNLIQCVDYGVYGVEPEDIPLCPECDQPMSAREGLTLQICDAGCFAPDLVRLVHTDCVEDGDVAEEESDQ